MDNKSNQEHLSTSGNKNLGPLKFKVEHPVRSLNRIISIVLTCYLYHVYYPKIPHQLSPISDQVTVSFGLACMVPSFDESPDILISYADQALYQAKQKGRNQYFMAM